ncbi:PREDICTED: NAC domain-containing protein 73-like isoform X2 [Nelumbo nucifera]|uniref:NAC domain-containing protein 73-like isoform X2 n=1 Tax=Nelumbo nucifera TaxID=4432 RepID=A0A1U7ZJZ6_NELNU|nr:PREDICTED: NAC domain-containing protein 73-like isoform X2 [Nelumbo nucifera]
MVKSWLIDGRGIAAKVKNATQFSSHQVKDLGANRQCPNCHHHIDNSDVSLEWPGLPAGVKFDPSDVELLEHLAGKVGVGDSEPHLFIDELIPTLEGNEGIYYTHPENLPGAKKDGSSVYFFHRTANAYSIGHRKRRKIHHQCNKGEEHVRWHKTGKTKPVVENGMQKGFKKIMVLYKSSKKGSKPDKYNWVMHQYHLGTENDEKEGQYVVSKIFYQQKKKHTDKSDAEIEMVQASPRTPKTKTPDIRQPRKGALCDVINEEKETEFIENAPQPPLSAVSLDDDRLDPAWWAGESQPVEDPDPNAMDDLLLCNEIFDSYTPIDNSVGLSDLSCHRNDALTDVNTASGIPNLDDVEIGITDFQLADLQFGSQESIMGWLDRL